MVLSEEVPGTRCTKISTLAAVLSSTFLTLIFPLSMALRIESIKEEIPLNRIGVSTDIAKCAKWLIEDNYTTGQVININGGWYI